MRDRLIVLACQAVVITGFVIGSLSSALAQPVIIRVETDTHNDTLWLGRTGSRIIFTVDPNGTDVAAVTFPLEFNFTNGNVIGAPPLSEIEIPGIFELVYFCEWWWCELQGTDPDSLLFGFVDFGGGGILGDSVNEVAWITFAPIDTGQILIDSIALPPANHLSAVDVMANSLPVQWISPPLTVVECVVMMGDVNGTGTITAADVIYLIMYFYKGGPEPVPWYIVGDVNCSGATTAADVIHLVQYMFKNGDPPCACHPTLIGL